MIQRDFFKEEADELKAGVVIGSSMSLSFVNGSVVDLISGGRPGAQGTLEGRASRRQWSSGSPMVPVPCRMRSYLAWPF